MSTGFQRFESHWIWVYSDDTFNTLTIHTIWRYRQKWRKNIYIRPDTEMSISTMILLRVHNLSIESWFSLKHLLELNIVELDQFDLIIDCYHTVIGWRIMAKSILFKLMNSPWNADKVLHWMVGHKNQIQVILLVTNNNYLITYLITKYTSKADNC